MAKTKKAVAKTTRKPKETKPVNEIKLVDFINRKLKDIGHDEDGVLTFFFDNGYSVKVTGNISLKKEKA